MREANLRPTKGIINCRYQRSVGIALLKKSRKRGRQIEFVSEEEQ